MEPSGAQDVKAHSEPADAIAALRLARQGVRLEGLTLGDMIKEDRLVTDADPGV